MLGAEGKTASVHSEGTRETYGRCSDLCLGSQFAKDEREKQEAQFPALALLPAHSCARGFNIVFLSFPISKKRKYVITPYYICMSGTDSVSLSEKYRYVTLHRTWSTDPSVHIESLSRRSPVPFLSSNAQPLPVCPHPTVSSVTLSYMATTKLNCLSQHCSPWEALFCLQKCKSPKPPSWVSSSRKPQQ